MSWADEGASWGEQAWSPTVSWGGGATPGSRGPTHAPTLREVWCDSERGGRTEQGAYRWAGLPSFNILFKFLLKVSSSFGNVDYSEQHNKRNNLDDLIEIFDNLNFSNIVIKKILNLGLFFSFVNLNYGTIVNNFLSRIFKGKVGFLYLIEIYQV